MVSHIADNVVRARNMGASAEAITAWRELLTHTHVDEADYADWARALAELYRRRGRGLAAGRIHEYLLSIGPALEQYGQDGSPRDVGRVLQLGRRLSEAARQYQEASLFAHAAQAAEEDGDLEFALSLYEQVTRQNEALGERYLAGLGALNGGRVAAELSRDNRRDALFAHATRLLEQEADEREQRGEREGAFRCYLCLIEIGKVEASYENLAEGYLNCIRILKAKADRFFTMQYYYDFISRAEELGELHSVAELYREAGEYARRVGFIYGDYFLQRAAKAWLHVGEVGLEQGNPPELVENALLAAVSCFNRIEDDRGVAECYRTLSELSLSDSKIKRYRTLFEELQDEAFQSGQPNEPQPFPEYFRRPVKMPKIWIRDLLVAESGKDIPDAIGRLVGDHKNVWEVQRRKALLISLMYDDHIRSGGDASAVPPAIIEKIGELNHAAAVPPLMALYEQAGPSTRVVILERASGLKQKEVFALIDRAVSDSNDAVQKAGIMALRRTTFPQALDSLVRIFNSHNEAEIKDTCLRSIAAIGTDEACEFLLDILRSNSAALGHRARALLEKHAQERMLSALERNRRREPDPNLRMFIGRLVDQIRTRRGSLAY